MRKWHWCKYDLGITLLVTVLAFFIGSHPNKLITQLIDKMITQLDWWILILLSEWGFLTAMVLIVVESLFIHLEHYWTWIVITIFCTTGARFAGQEIGRNVVSGNIFNSFIIDLFLNSLIYGVFVIPGAALVFLVRRKFERNNKNGI